MKTLWTVALCLSCLSTFAADKTPIIRGVLQTDLDANQKKITNGFFVGDGSGLTGITGAAGQTNIAALGVTNAPWASTNSANLFSKSNSFAGTVTMTGTNVLPPIMQITGQGVSFRAVDSTTELGFMDDSGVMVWNNFIPPANGAGQIGSTVKYWSQLFVSNSIIKTQYVSDMLIQGKWTLSSPTNATAAVNLMLTADGIVGTNALGSGSGTVTSVALAAPSEFSVSGSPVTTSGTLTFAKANQNANIVYAGPASGGAAAPTFRALASGDFGSTVVPDLALSQNVALLNANQTFTGSNAFSGTLSNGFGLYKTNGGPPYFIGNATNATVILPQETANTILTLNGGKSVKSLANGGNNTLLHGTAPPAYSAVDLAADVTGSLPFGSLSGTIAANQFAGFTGEVTNGTGSGGYALMISGTGNHRWQGKADFLKAVTVATNFSVGNANAAIQSTNIGEFWEDDGVSPRSLKFNIHTNGTAYFNSGLANPTNNFPGVTVITNLVGAFRAGTTNIGNLATSLLITFSSPMPDANYAVSVIFDSTLAAAVTPGATSKTASGFTLTLSAGISGGASLDYTIWPYR